MPIWIDGAVRLLHTATEAVHHSTIGAEVQVAQQGEQLVVGLAHMQAHRQAKLSGPPHLPFQHLALLLQIGLVPVQVKPYLPYPDIVGRRGEQLFVHNGQLGLETLAHRGGMESHHLPEILGVARGQGLLPGVTRAVDTRQEHHVNTDGNSSRHRLIAVGVESLVIEMAVRVNHSLTSESVPSCGRRVPDNRHCPPTVCGGSRWSSCRSAQQGR